MKRTIRLTESDLHRIVRNSVKRIIRESIDNNYTHFAVNKDTDLIVNGWDYSDVDPEDLRMDKRGYFINDLIDNNFNPKEYRILTLRSCKRRGINPFDGRNWSNDGVTPLG